MRRTNVLEDTFRAQRNNHCLGVGVCVYVYMGIGDDRLLANPPLAVCVCLCVQFRCTLCLCVYVLLRIIIGEMFFNPLSPVLQSLVVIALYQYSS